MNEYIKSPINYVGNKYRLIKQIIPLFPKKISMFVDAFGGSGTVLMNTEADYYIYNDIILMFQVLCRDCSQRLMMK